MTGTYYPWDARKIDKEYRQPLKEFWNSLDDTQRKLVGMLMSYSEQSEREWNTKYKDYR